jgi:hypothetical protein
MTTKTIFSREFLQYATITKFRVCLSRIFENETCKLTDEHHSLTQQIVPGVDGITTSAYGNVVTEAEVEQSSACHVRDVCAAEQNTLMIATATTLQCSSCSYVTFRHTCHSQWIGLQQKVDQLRFPPAWQYRRPKIRTSHRFYDRNYNGYT